MSDDVPPGLVEWLTVQHEEAVRRRQDVILPSSIQFFTSEGSAYESLMQEIERRARDAPPADPDVAAAPPVPEPFGQWLLWQIAVVAGRARLWYGQEDRGTLTAYKRTLNAYNVLVDAGRASAARTPGSERTRRRGAVPPGLVEWLTVQHEEAVRRRQDVILPSSIQFFTSEGSAYKRLMQEIERRARDAPPPDPDVAAAPPVPEPFGQWLLWQIDVVAGRARLWYGQEDRGTLTAYKRTLNAYNVLVDAAAAPAARTPGRERTRRRSAVASRPQSARVADRNERS